MNSALCISLVMLLPSQASADESDLRKALTFHASFDTSVDADVAQGDGKIYTAQSLKREKLSPGLDSANVVWEKDNGRFGGALRFTKKTDRITLFQGRRNVPYEKNALQGTVSLWMKLNPDEDLPEGFVDPLQITDKKWNDASFFLDFDKELPRTFRLGVFSNYKFWNPEDHKWDDIADKDRPLIPVAKPPFSREEWTHVAYTYRNFNRDGAGKAVLYLNGKQQGTMQGPQKYSWNPDKVAIMIGIYYVGLMDELAIFDRPLDATEIARLYALPQGIASLK